MCSHPKRGSENSAAAAADAADTTEPAPVRPSVNVVTLGCARNEVDSEELAARLVEAGWELADDGAEAGVVLVNTCGFIDAAKRESIDELLSAAGTGAKVVATGCLAERYGTELADALPEAQILGFDDYGDIADRLTDVVAGRRRPAHTARDRRTLLPISPVRRHAANRGGHDRPGGSDRGRTRTGEADGTGADRWPGPPSGPRVLRHRLAHGVVAPLKIAAGCDRRCAFCAIPTFRGAFVSRGPDELVAEAAWLAAEGVTELLLVSENSTSYGKDLGNLRLLEELLPTLAATPGIERVRVSYLQPAELRPGLISVMTGTPGVAPYFDLSFQHASGPVLRGMRRFGDRPRFLDLLATIRDACPQAGVRSNFIVGFPGETAADLRELELFLDAADLDAIGVFGYSDEDGTEAAARTGEGAGKLGEGEIRRRVTEVADLADEVMARRAASRVGETVDVLVEERLPDGSYQGRAAHQAPEVDGATTVRSARPDAGHPGAGHHAWSGHLSPGRIVRATVVAAEGVDLVATDAAGGSAVVGVGSEGVLAAGGAGAFAAEPR